MLSHSSSHLGDVSNCLCSMVIFFTFNTRTAEVHMKTMQTKVVFLIPIFKALTWQQQQWWPRPLIGLRLQATVGLAYEHRWSLTHLLFANCKRKLRNKHHLVCRDMVSPAAILVRSTKPSPNQFAWIYETGFRLDKSIAWNRKILILILDLRDRGQGQCHSSWCHGHKNRCWGTLRPGLEDYITD